MGRWKRLVPVLAFVAAVTASTAAEARAQSTHPGEVHIRQVTGFRGGVNGTDGSEARGIDPCATRCVPLRLGGSASGFPPGRAMAVNQVGSNNDARLVGRGGSNRASVRQLGSRNVTNVALAGRNRFRARQIGDRNEIHGQLSGRDNSLRVLQKGNDNSYRFDYERSGMDMTVQQFGNDLSLRVRPGKNGALPLKVVQTDIGLVPPVP